MKGYSYFLNRRNSADGFKESINGSIFVDKSLLIDFVNEKLSTKEKWICVSRPRRFGKTMALEMLAAYYTRGIHTDDLFCSLEIKHTLNYHKHLNAHNTVCINFNDYFENNGTIHEGIERLSGYLLQDLRNTFPNVCPEHADLPLAFDMVQQATGEKFIFLIDEWDCVFRLKKGRKQEQEEFLSFLRMLFKDKTYVELVYMTGILPIKKYNTGSALNMFREYTILEPKKLGPFFGFTVEETKKLCAQFRTLRLEEVREWYDGYYLAGTGFILNPRSVVEALEEGVCRDYWNKTGGYSELEEYITMDFDGLGSTVAELLAGEQAPISVLGFSNDLDSFQNKDEVLTALIHMGYLTYENGSVRIPNREIREEFADTVKKLSWGAVSKLLNQSRRLLKATLEMDERTVADFAARMNV